MTLWIGNVYEGSTTLSLILYKKKSKCENNIYIRGKNYVAYVVGYRITKRNTLEDSTLLIMK
jgi:hypothetical protein